MQKAATDVQKAATDVRKGLKCVMSNPLKDLSVGQIEEVKALIRKMRAENLLKKDPKKARMASLRAELRALRASKASPPTSETVFYGPLLTQTAESIGRTPQEVLEHIVSKKEAELRLTQVEVDILFENTTSD